MRCHRLLILALVILTAAMANIAASTYYVDGITGDDTNDGLSATLAWQTLDKVNDQTFQPGDVILFKSGSRWNGQLNPQGSGAADEHGVKSIRIASYGEGPRPRLDGEGLVRDTLLLRNVEFWEVADLEITNQGTNREPWRTGVRVLTDGFGAMRHIVLTNLFVHDVNGDLRKEQEGCGIFFESRGRNQSRFDGLRIENCHVVRTDRNGICQRNRSRTRSTNVVIRGNLLEDIGGDGIKLWGTNGGLIEHNVLRGGRMRCEDYAAGIWPFDCDDTVIQFNEVSGMRGTKDGQGFDSDYLCRGSVFQYNYSHDNEGGFMLICTPGNSYNENTVIRYNISQNDGINSARVFHFGGGAKNTSVYNNTIYVGAGQDLPLLLFTEWKGGNANGTKFYNNVFWVEGKARYEWGQSTNTAFENNVFYGHHAELPPDPAAITNRIALVNPGSGGSGFASLDGYRPQPNATFPHGRIVPDNGRRDFFGETVSADSPPSVGCAEAAR